MSDFPIKRIFTKAQLGGEAVNFLRYILSSNVTASATTLPVTTNPTTKLPDGSSGSLFVSVGAPGVDVEIMLVTSRDSSNIYVTRNADGQGAYAHNSGDYVRVCVSGNIFNMLADVIADLQTVLVATAVCAEDVEAFRAVCYNSSGLFINAKANALTTSLVVGMVQSRFAAGQTAIALRMGLITNTNWTYTAQKRLWLSDVQAGVLSEGLPQTGSYQVCCGITKTMSSIEFRCPDYSTIAQM